MTSSRRLFQFYFTGVRGHVIRTGGFGLASASLGLFTDVVQPFSHAVWWMSLVFFALFLFSLVYVFARLLRCPTVDVGQDQPALPNDVPIARDVSLFFAIMCVALSLIGVLQLVVRQPGQPIDQVSFVSSVTGWMKQTTGQLDTVIDQQKQANATLENVKKETSDDPRKELANLGVDWKLDLLLDAFKRGDERLVRLFLQAGMPVFGTSENGRTLPVSLAENEYTARQMVQLLVEYKVDLNALFKSPGFASVDHRYSLLGRAIDVGNRPLLDALIEAGADVDSKYDTFATMGFSKRVLPLVACIEQDRPDFALALLDAGADPAADEYAPYRALTYKMAGVSKPALKDVEAFKPVFEKIAPPIELADRIDSELKLQVVEHRLNEVAKESFRHSPGTARKRELDQQYDQLQIERTELKKKLGS